MLALAPSILISTFLTSALARVLPLHSRDSQQFEITSLAAQFPTTGSAGTGPIDSSISITLTYPAPSGNATLSTTCSHAWPASPGPGPTDWDACADPLVQWRLPAEGWTSDLNFRVEVFETLTAAGTGFAGSQYLDFQPGGTSDPSAYLSCIQMGKFNPLTCQLDGPLSQHQSPVVFTATPEDARPE